MQPIFAKVKNMGKYIIAICAPQNSGKTSTINNVWDILPSYYSGSRNNEKHIIDWSFKYEILGYVDSHTPDTKPIIRNWKTGVNSLGDNVNQVKVGLALLSDLDCDIIVCAARKTKWIREAIDNINSTTFEKVFKQNEYAFAKIDLKEIEAKLAAYTVIFTTPYIYEGSNPIALKHVAPPFESPIKLGGVNLDRVMAQNIVNLIERLGI